MPGRVTQQAEQPQDTLTWDILPTSGIGICTFLCGTPDLSATMNYVTLLMLCTLQSSEDARALEYMGGREAVSGAGTMLFQTLL